MLTLNVKFNSNKSIQVRVNDTENIKSLKDEIAKKHNVSADEVRIIFQGKELRDSTEIKACDFGQQTVLHAVRRKRCSASENHLGLNHISSFPETLECKENDTSGLMISQFYVYCKTPCKDVTFGKIRVQCSICKLGTLQLDRDPSCWDDVLIPGQITGVCQAEICNGRTAEFYFKCASHPSSEGDTAVVLNLLKNNTRRVPCLACMDEQPTVIVFQCEDQHTMCLQCFKDYCETKLNDRAFIQDPSVGYTLACPAGCDNSLIKEPHHFRVIGNDQYDRYQRFGTEECLLRMGGVLCPAPGCGAGILPREGVREVVCERSSSQGCGFKFCHECLESYHEGNCDSVVHGAEASGSTNSEIAIRNANHARWEQEAKEVIRQTTKRCPECNVPTEKSGGCNHMKCSRCRFEWCWLCVQEWNRDCQGGHWFQ